MSNVPGPGQAQNNFNASADVSEGNSTCSNPARPMCSAATCSPCLSAGGLVYVQPVYVKSSGSTSFPLLKKVLVAFGDQVGFADTLDEALDQVFGGDSGASAGDAENVGDTTDDKQDAKNDDSADGKTNTDGKQDTPSNTDGKTGGNNGDSSGTMSADLKKALADAAQAMKDSDAAMKKGDWSAYGDAQKQLQEALNKAIELEQ